MKNKKTSLVIATAITFAACGQMSGSRDGSLAFETVTVEKSVSISSEQDAPQCSVRLQIASAKDNDNEKAKAINSAIAERLLDMEGLTLQQAADSFANSYTRNYVRDFAPLYREDRNDPEKRAWYQYHYNITSEAAGGRKGITVYTATIDYYEGGAHGINQRIVMNIDNQTGKVLELNDVFVPGYETVLNEKLTQALLEKTDARDIGELRNRGYLYSMDMFAPENFVLGKENITFIYNAYEIASYSEGIIELALDYNDLEEIWK